MKHCVHQSARWRGQNRNADSASTTYPSARAPPATPAVSQIAQPRAYRWTVGNLTNRSSSSTPALTESSPPCDEFCVMRGFSYTSTRGRPSASSLGRRRTRSCITTLRGSTRHGTKGRWRVGRLAHSSSQSFCTAASAAAVWSATPVWCHAKTVSMAHSERASTPPSPTWAMMSASTRSQPSSAATRRSAALSIWRAPGKTVSRVDRATGRQSSGSEQSHTTYRANSGCSSCAITTVGTDGGDRPPRSAAAAASANRIHA